MLVCFAIVYKSMSYGLHFNFNRILLGRNPHDTRMTLVLTKYLYGGYQRPDFRGAGVFDKKIKLETHFLASLTN